MPWTYSIPLKRLFRGTLWSGSLNRNHFGKGPSADTTVQNHLELIDQFTINCMGWVLEVEKNNTGRDSIKSVQNDLSGSQWNRSVRSKSYHYMITSPFFIPKEYHGSTKCTRTLSRLRWAGLPTILSSDRDCAVLLVGRSHIPLEQFLVQIVSAQWNNGHILPWALSPRSTVESLLRR